MARPAFWRGYLKLSLVTAAVTLTPATTESRKVRFHILNRATGNRVTSRYVDSITHRAVADRNQVRGYPKGEDDYVLIEDERLGIIKGHVEYPGQQSYHNIWEVWFAPDGRAQRFVEWFMVPRKHIATLQDCQPEDQALLGKMMLLAPKLAAEQGYRFDGDASNIEGNGFRVVMNTGPGGGQEVYHLHMHILAGPRPWKRM